MTATHKNKLALAVMIGAGLALASVTHAKVGADKASQLGGSLTPMGGEICREILSAIVGFHRLYEICLVRFLAFRVPCRLKLVYFCA